MTPPACAPAAAGRTQSPPQGEHPPRPSVHTASTPIDAPLAQVQHHDGKHLATLIARAALLGGYTCKQTDAGSIVLGRNGAGWIFSTIDAANAWLDRLDQPSTEVPA